MTKPAQPSEFSRPFPTARVPRKGCHEHLQADELECAALAKRFAIPKLHTFSARLVLSPWRGGGIKVKGTVEADMDRICIVSLESFRARAQFALERFFLPDSEFGADRDDDADIIIGGEIDLGEVAAETLGLDLDPYPRKPGQAFVNTEGEG